MISQNLAVSTARLSDYLELAKLRLVGLVILSMVVGFYLGSEGPMNAGLFWICFLGTGFVAAGSMALNQWMERREDARMQRTLSRPLPAGRLQTQEAFLFGLFLSAAGLLALYFCVNRAAALLALTTLVSYLWLYTPLKRKTTLCTIVGAVPGAIPPLIGWAAAAGKPNDQAWILFVIIFFWQMPHFLAIAWMYRKDYAAAEFRMLSVLDPTGAPVARQILLYALALLPVSLLPSLAGMTGPFYFLGALGLGLGFCVLCLSGLKDIQARAPLIFRASILHLSLLLILMVLNKS